MCCAKTRNSALAHAVEGAVIERQGMGKRLLMYFTNRLRDAVDPDFWTTTDSAISNGENISDGEEVDADELPLNHLRPCVLGENGVPAGRSMYEDSNGESGMFVANAI